MNVILALPCEDLHKAKGREVESRQDNNDLLFLMHMYILHRKTMIDIRHCMSKHAR
jgi:hypothetical protein